MESGNPKLVLPPSLAGLYDNFRELAVGGMGIIWLAREKAKERDVVFKFIAPELLGDEETRIRFLNEAKLTAQLEHSHIVQLYAAGEEEGSLYIIYEYLDGTNLKTLLEKYGAYRIGQALEILIKVSDGIACAHRHKILHRDIKPENILVSPLGDKVKIVDFGIAKSIEDSQKLTQTGFIIGTPEYLSPEQAVGHKATYASDQYALAVLAYEMLTARLPIEDNNTVDLFTKKIRGAWVPIRDRRPEIPIELAKIIEKAMATEAAQRYLTVDDFVKALSDFSTRRSAVGMQRPGSAKAAPGGQSNPSTKPAAPATGQRTSRTSGANPVHKPASGAGAAIGKLIGGLVAVAAVVAIGFAAVKFWPKGNPDGPLPRMFGNLASQHEPDGVHLAWDLAGGGNAFVHLNPGDKELPMVSEKGRYRVVIPPPEARQVQSIDLYVKDGAQVTTEVKGVPFLTVAAAGDTVAVTVPPLSDAAPVLMYWPAGKDSTKKEFPLKTRGRGFFADGVPMAAGEDLVLQVVSGGPEKQPLTFLQKVPSLGTFLEAVETKLGKHDVVTLLTTTPDAGTPEGLAKRTAKVFDELKAQLSPEAIDTVKELVASPAVEASRKLKFFEIVHRLELLRVMGTRAGWTGKSAELEALMDITWPARVKNAVEKPLMGQRKPPSVDRAKLMGITAESTLVAAGVEPEKAKKAVLEIRFLTFGVGTYAKVTVNKKAIFYVWGPDTLPETITAQQAIVEAQMEASLLQKGENEIVVETQPVLALVGYEAELRLIPPYKLSVDGATPTLTLKQ